MAKNENEKLMIFSTPELEGKNDRPQDPTALTCGSGAHRIKLCSRAGQGGTEKHPTSCQKSNPGRPVQNVRNSISCYTIKQKTITYIFEFILYHFLAIYFDFSRMSNKNYDYKNYDYKNVVYSR